MMNITGVLWGAMNHLHDYAYDEEGDTVEVHHVSETTHTIELSSPIDSDGYMLYLHWLSPGYTIINRMTGTYGRVMGVSEVEHWFGPYNNALRVEVQWLKDWGPKVPRGPA